MNNQLFKLFSLVTGPKAYVPPTPAVEYNNATGGTITEYTNAADGRKYRVHTFTANDSFAVSTAVDTFRVFAIGGGGPGGSSGGGGGGGGKGIENLTQQLAVGSYPVTIGGNSQPTSLGTAVISQPGGAGQPWDGGNQQGGASNYPGGSGSRASWAEIGGGGGGAGGAGASPGNGGIGMTTTIRGITEKFGGGGGGGGARDSNPGSGQDGGGNGAKGGDGQAGAANTGGGGGAAGLAPVGNGAPGGSGILIVSYEIAAGPPPPTFNAIVGGTYVDVENYNGTGLKYRVHTFDTAGAQTLEVTAAVSPFRALAIGGGGNGGNGGNPGQGGQAVDTSVLIPVGMHDIMVGGAGGSTYITDIITAAGGASQTGGAGGGMQSTITGSAVGYAGNGGKVWWNYCCPANGDAAGPGGGHWEGNGNASFYGAGGGGQQHTQSGPWNGFRGVLIIAYQIAS